MVIDMTRDYGSNIPSKEHKDPKKQEPYEPIPIHYLDEDQNWDDAED